MVIKNARFELTAVMPQQYPAGGIPEIAFVGRSNAGKSSLINTLINRKSLARVGETPGVTKGINFYNIDDILYLVDLPGYGYARVSKSKKLSWNEVVEAYLFSRRQLKLILMLVDIRHTPSADDKTMYKWLLDHNIQHMVIATKLDKISRNMVSSRLDDIKSTLGIGADTVLLPFSSATKQGRDELWTYIEYFK